MAHSDDEVSRVRFFEWPFIWVLNCYDWVMGLLRSTPDGSVTTATMDTDPEVMTFNYSEVPLSTKLIGDEFVKLDPDGVYVASGVKTVMLFPPKQPQFYSSGSELEVTGPTGWADAESFKFPNVKIALNNIPGADARERIAELERKLAELQPPEPPVDDNLPEGFRIITLDEEDQS